MQLATDAKLQPSPQQAKRPPHAHIPNWGPVCCKQEMFEMVRRAILRGDGSVVFCSVWHCLNCGRLLL